MSRKNQSLTHVMHLTTHLGKGGAAANVLLSCAGLADRGYQVSLLHGPTESAEQELVDRARKSGVEFCEIRHLVRDIHPPSDLPALLEIRRELRRSPPDILHTHQSKAGLLGRLIGKRLPYTFIVHTPHGHVFYGYFSRWKTSLFVQLERWAARRCDRLVGLTSKEVKEHLDRKIGDPAKWRVIHSGIDLDQVRRQTTEGMPLRERFGVPDDAVILVSLGRLEPVKGYCDFLHVFAEAATRSDLLYWFILGEGSQRREIESMIVGRDLSERVRLVGWQTEPFGLVRQCDALLLPSRNEGMGRVAVEAFALGLPVFASDAGSIPELVSDPELGDLFSWHTPERIPDKLMDFVQGLPAHRSHTQQRIRKAESYSVEEMVQRLVDCYQELVRHRGGE